MPGPGLDIEQILIAEIQGMRAEFRAASRELGELAAQVKLLAIDSATIRELERRLTILETEHKTTESWVENSRKNTRWLVALAVTTVLTVAGLAVAVFQHR